jgi:hypothetical protein
MRIKLLTLLATIGLVASAAAAAQAPAAATAPASDATDAVQTATWTKRKLVRFSPPSNYVPANGYESNTHFLSCDEIIARVEFLLRQLGARDISVDQRDCRRNGIVERSLDVSFLALAPTDTMDKRAAGALVDAHWQTVQMGGADVQIGDCAFLRYATIKLLPLFATRNVKLIPEADCARLGVGLRAQILRPARLLVDAPPP